MHRVFIVDFCFLANPLCQGHVRQQSNKRISAVIWREVVDVQCFSLKQRSRHRPRQHVGQCTFAQRQRSCTGSVDPAVSSQLQPQPGSAGQPITATKNGEEINQLAQNGVVVLVVSRELPEDIMDICDRILVIRAGAYRGRSRGHQRRSRNPGSHHGARRRRPALSAQSRAPVQRRR